jgi:hypothetical protein
MLIKKARLEGLCTLLVLPDFQRELTDGLLADNVVDGLPEEMRRRLWIEIRSHSALVDTDATSMAASIEVRLPLVDKVCLKQSSLWTIQNDAIRWGKSLFCEGPVCAGWTRGCSDSLRRVSCYPTTGGLGGVWAR